MTPPHLAGDDPEGRRGVVYGFTAYGLWGVFPLYFALLKPAGALEILAHRILWTAAVCLLVLLVIRQWAWVGPLVRSPRRLGFLALATSLISVNWTLYTFAVLTGHVTEAALGYFLNPLVTVAIGVVVLRESLRPLQWVAVGLGVVAAIYLTVDYGAPPWISLALAFSFALYGLLKKQIKGLSAVQGLAGETIMAAPVAVILLVVLGTQGQSTWSGHGIDHQLLLLSAGIATALPLLCFAAAARRVPLVTIGLLQFLTPVLQLLCGVLLLGEHMELSRWIGFAIVWLALIALSTDSLRAARARRLARAAQGATA